ncbi:MAG: hypothetical protein J6Q02_02575 [Lachnospiraceae bacterium]|nr:hypothetical protein [Lachnospiraceae bacterium]
MSELMNLFTPDKTVEMTHTEYAALVREAVKAELLMNAVRAEVPSFYVNAMLTGQKVTWDETELTIEESEATNMGEVTGAIESLYKSIKDRGKLITVSDSLVRMQTIVRDLRIFEIESEEEDTSEEVRENEQT